jgi:serine/threonine protein kinase
MIGESVSHYRIIEKLGSGGMGEVYKAEDTKLKRFVALKFLPTMLSVNEDAKKRLIIEAQAASSLQHNNICTIHEIEETEDGQLFICMDYYLGETLEEKIKKEPLNLSEAINIIIQVSEGLYKAHQNKIIHRDIKPSNIFVTDDGIVKILDFGLAKRSEQTQLTKINDTYGTISYMSPEQSIGEEVDSRTDLWSLGTVFYEMLSGKKPFRGDYDQAIIYSILNEKPEDLKKTFPDIPAEVEKIILKLLEKEKGLRYQSAYDLIIDLKKISGEPYSKVDVFFIKRKKLLLRLGGISLIVLLFIFYLKDYFFNYSPKEFKPISISVLTFENNTGDTSLNYLKTALPNLFITNLEQSRMFEVTTWERLQDLIKQSDEKSIKSLDKDVGFQLCKLDGISTLALGSITKAGNFFATDVKLFNVETKKLINSVSAKGEGLESILESQIDELSKNITEKIAGISQPETQIKKSIIELTTNSLEAYNFYLRGNDKFSILNFDSAVEMYKRAINLDSNFAMAYNNLAVCYSYLFKNDEMKWAINKALELSKNSSDKERKFIEGQYAILIEENINKAQKIFVSLNRDYPKDKRILMYLSYCYDQLGKELERHKVMKEILSLDPTHANTIGNVGYYFLNRNMLDSARYYFTRMLTAYPQELNSYDVFGDYYLIKGDLDSAKIFFEKALLYELSFIVTGIKQAYLSALTENFEEACRIVDKEILKSSGSRKSIAYCWKAYYYFLTKNYKQAFQSLSLAEEIQKSFPDNNRLFYINYLRAWFNLEIDNFSQAEFSHKESMTFLDDGAYKSALQLLFASYTDLRSGKLDSIKSNINRITNYAEQFSPRQMSQLKYKDRISNSLKYLEAERLLAENKPQETNSLQVTQYIPFLKFYENMILDNLPFEKDVFARSQIKLGNISKAISEYERLLDFNKRENILIINPIYHFRLAKLYERQNKFKMALNEHKKFLKICKDADETDKTIIYSKQRIVELSKYGENNNEK